MACTGQVPMQAPQSMQVLSSHSAFPSTMERALTGHTPTQASQPMQVSLSILTAMIGLLDSFGQGYIPCQKGQGFFALAWFATAEVAASSSSALAR